MIPSNRRRPERPSHKELSKKLRECQELVRAGKWSPAEPAKLKANFDELEAAFAMDTTLADDQRKILMGSLCEITPDHYVGGRPTTKSSEPRVRGAELLAFSWKSSFFSGSEMYFKFCVSGENDARRAFVCSIHEHREGDDE